MFNTGITNAEQDTRTNDACKRKFHVLLLTWCSNWEA